jgi:mRNA-degrading endonuclease RelE of RelBE toxin-antitoxin system
MSYTISILRRAKKELAQLPGGAYEQVRDAISALSREPRPAGCDKLTARLHIGHRRDIYR